MIKRISHILLILCTLSVCPCICKAGVWQWRVSLDCVSNETHKAPDAFLWVPEKCDSIKAVIVGKHNMSEETLFEMPSFRERMSELGVALVWITPGIDINWDVTKGTQDVFDKMMRDFAEKSGYSELATAPVVPIGHSAMATYPWNFAAWNPDRTLAIISLHGDAPRTNLCGYGGPNLEWGRTRNIDGIPGLMIMGEYEWGDDRLWPALGFRMSYPKSTVSFLCDAGHGHFDVSESLASFIALFVEKSIEYRLGADGLKSLNPADGWLVEQWRGDNYDIEIAPSGSFKKCPHEAFWTFDEETAKATKAYYGRSQGKKERFLGFIQNGKMLEYNPNSHARINGMFRPEKDSRTFHIQAVFTDSLRRESASKSKKVSIDRICGPVRKVNDSTFVIDFYRMGMDNPRRTNDIWLLAHDDGDEEYKSSVQQLNIKIPYRITNGKEQNLLFPSLPDINPGSKTVKLKAKSDLNLPVSYYVKEGPAVIDGNKLIITPIPPRSKFPIEISVVAWQYGIDGEANTAEPVTQSFLITE